MRWVQELALLPHIGEARVLLELRREMGPIAFSAQYQQSPIPPGGTIIKRKWLASYDEVPTRDRGDHIIMSWDIALSDEEKGDYFACVVLFRRREVFFVLEVIRATRRAISRSRSTIARNSPAR